MLDLSMFKKIADYLQLNNREDLDTRTQSEIDNSREKIAYDIAKYPGFGGTGPAALDESALANIISERSLQSNSIPLRNADHYLTSLTGSGAGSAMVIPYTMLKMLRGGLDSAPDPIGDLKWSTKPVLSGEVPIGDMLKTLKRDLPYYASEYLGYRQKPKLEFINGTIKKVE